MKFSRVFFYSSSILDKTTAKRLSLKFLFFFSAPLLRLTSSTHLEKSKEKSCYVVVRELRVKSSQNLLNRGYEMILLSGGMQCTTQLVHKQQQQQQKRCVAFLVMNRVIVQYTWVIRVLEVMPYIKVCKGKVKWRKALYNLPLKSIFCLITETKNGT